MPSFLIFVGRFCMGALFLFSAYWHVTNWEVAIAKTAATGTPSPDFILIFATLLLGIGGISLLLGFKTRLGATLLIIEILMTAYIFNPFWTMGAAEIQLGFLAFLSRIALCGGLFFLLGSGPGQISIDSHRAK